MIHSIVVSDGLLTFLRKALNISRYALSENVRRKLAACENLLYCDKIRHMNLTYRKVHQLAQEKGMSIRMLCDHANVHYPTVCNWKRKEPKQFKILQALTDVEPQEKQSYRVTVVTDLVTRKHTIEAFDDSDAMQRIQHHYDREFSDEVVAEISFE